ncbi:MAG: NPCBM/NEW2 domain-containing protein, partial [Bacteroidota bacterium]
PIVVAEYKKNRALFPDQEDPVEAYRTTLLTIRETIGENRYLLGCWGMPIEGVGIMNGSRTGGDIVLGWEGFREALSTTMKHYYLHNVAWYCDPDVMLLRSPMSLDQARAWATLQGLTGQALMASDRMMDLAPERVELLKRVFPAVDIRPLDLFPSQRNKRIWDLKVHQGERNYDVVGVFNFDETTAEQTVLRWHDLGITDTGAVHVYDFWNKEYLGCWKGGFNVEVGPTSCRVLSVQPATDHVELVSTSRHITQGWVDIIDAGWNAKANLWTGTSRLIAGDPYELRFAFPRGRNMIVKKATAGSLPVRITNHQGWATVGFTPAKTQNVKWTVEFAPAPVTYHFPVYKPDTVMVERSGMNGAILRWAPQYYLTAGYHVYLNGDLYAYTPSPTMQLRELDPHHRSTVEVASVWEDGTESKKRAAASFVPLGLLPAEVTLSDEEPVRATIGWGTLQKNKSVGGSTLTVGGIRFTNGLGTHANSEIEYRLYALFDTLTASVGLDDDTRDERGSVEFSVLADGKEIWRSGVLKRRVPAKAFGLNIRGVQTLILRVTDAGDGIDYDHADWIEPRVMRK